MILRRVIQHVRKQEWTAIWIDLVIVVVGVFIGIQVSNWNAAGADERRGEEYVRRLIADLKQDHDTRTGLLAYYDAVSNSAVRAIELLNAPTADDRLLVVNVYRATEMAHEAQRRATWDEIVSSGDLGLLPRTAVEEVLNRYYGQDHSISARGDIVDSGLRLLVRSTIPNNVQAAIRAGCSDITDSNGRVLGFVAECVLDLPPEELAAAAEVLKADPQLSQRLTFHVAVLTTNHTNFRGDLFEIGRAIELLRGTDSAATPLEHDQSPAEVGG